MSAEVTWVGHGSLRLDVGDFRGLTDPLLTRRLGHLRRRGALPDSGLLDTDVVLISHAHHDHLHRRSLRKVAVASPGVPIVVPRGARRFVEGLGLGPITEVSPGDVLDVPDGRVIVTEAVHKGGRGRKDDPQVETVGFVIEADGRRVYFAGDTDLFDGMADLGPIDLAALPIAGWWHRLGPGHMDETRAAEAVQRIDPALVLPVHWGTYAPEDLRRWPTWLETPGQRFAEELDERGLSERLLLLQPGESSTW